MSFEFDFAMCHDDYDEFSLKPLKVETKEKDKYEGLPIYLKIQLHYNDYLQTLENFISR